MRFFQILVTIVKGDAIGNYALILNKLIKNMGYNSEIFAENIGPGLSQYNINSFAEFPEVQEDDVVIYHMCERTKINIIIQKLRCMKIAIYHNTTPPEFFEWLDKKQTRIQIESQWEIQNLKNTFDYCIADSEYNKTDLIKMGYDEKKITVLPVILAYEDYFKIPDSKTIAKYSDGWVNILFVGRIVPNKKQEDIIRIFSYYKKNVNPKSRLILVGSPFSDQYLQCLKEYIKKLKVEDVVFPGHIAFNEIIAFYKVADIFLCMSEHEGFCVPLIESMLFDVPIIAYKSTAIPYTLGDSGVMVDDKDPILISELIERIVMDKNLKNEILEKQRLRLKKFDRDMLEKEYEQKLLEVIGGIYEEKNSYNSSEIWRRS